MEIPVDQQTIEKRTTIDSICLEPDLIQEGEIPDIKIIERRIIEDDEGNKHDCWWYIGRMLNQAVLNERNFTPEGYMFIEINNANELAEGDLIVYYKIDGVRLLPAHIGIYKGKQHVHSKWGYSHVFEHGIFSVPLSYGFMISAYRKVKLVK